MPVRKTLYAKVVEGDSAGSRPEEVVVEDEIGERHALPRSSGAVPAFCATGIAGRLTVEEDLSLPVPMSFPVAFAPKGPAFSVDDLFPTAPSREAATATYGDGSRAEPGDVVAFADGKAPCGLEGAKGRVVDALPDIGDGNGGMVQVVWRDAKLKRRVSELPVDAGDLVRVKAASREAR